MAYLKSLGVIIAAVIAFVVCIGIGSVVMGVVYVLWMAVLGLVASLFTGGALWLAWEARPQWMFRRTRRHQL